MTRPKVREGLGVAKPKIMEGSEAVWGRLGEFQAKVWGGFRNVLGAPGAENRNKS